MDNTKLKRVRIIGLIALTIAVVIAVALSVYFVDKKDKKDNAPPQYTTYSVGEIIQCDTAQYSVRDIQFLGAVEGVQAQPDKVLCIVYITVHSGNIAARELSIDGGAPIIRDFTPRERSVTIDAVRQDITFKPCTDSASDNCFIVFECSDKGIKYLVCKGARIALGEPHITEA